jgi:hemoglobin-like flavoprotein
MSPDQKTLVQTTWDNVVPIADTASALFYQRLFELDPAVRTLFAGVDLESQRRKLIRALALVVGTLDDIEGLVPTIAALGRRHAAYGVVDADYETVGAALLWTLEEGLGDAWTADVAAAWAAAYAFVAGVMRGAAADNRGRPSPRPATAA